MPLRIFLATVVLSVAALAAAHKPPSPTTISPGSITRQAQIYNQLESNLDVAIMRRDLTTLNKIVSSSFLIQTETGEVFYSAEALLRDAGPSMRYKSRDPLSIYALGEFDVISFVRHNPQSLQGQTVLDIWNREDARLVMRVVSSIHGFIRPGQLRKSAEK